jgi:acetyl esterase
MAAPLLPAKNIDQGGRSMMPLDAHVRALLDMLAASGQPKISDVPPPAAREMALALTQMVEAKDIPIGRIENGALPGPAAAIPFRIYTPAGSSGDPLAAIVYFHGGAWVFGNLDTHDAMCRMLANESGCRVISIDYRLAPEHKFPAAVEDALAATQWVAASALRLGIDADRIAVAGDSAGGNLAAVVCQLAKVAGPKLALQVLFCPVADIGAETPSRRDFAEGYFLELPLMRWAGTHYLALDADLKDPRLSPLHAADLSGLPAAHIHTAAFDPLLDEGKAYADALGRAGVKVHYTCHEGMIHHFYAMAGAIPYGKTAMEAAGESIKAALSAHETMAAS